MRNKDVPEVVKRRASVKSTITVWGILAILLSLLHLVVTYENVYSKYIVFGLYLLLGIIMIIKHKLIGNAIFSASVNGYYWLGKWIFRMRENVIWEKLDQLQSSFLGREYHIWLTVCLGIYFTAFSIWQIVEIADGVFA